MGETVKILLCRSEPFHGIDYDKNLWEVVSDGLDHMMVGETEVPSRAYVASFGFKARTSTKRAGVLSGGERNRVNWRLRSSRAATCCSSTNPRSNLDVETLSQAQRHCSSSRAARWSLATTVCSWTASAHSGVGGHRRESGQLVLV